MKSKFKPGDIVFYSGYGSERDYNRWMKVYETRVVDPDPDDYDEDEYEDAESWIEVKTKWFQRERRHSSRNEHFDWWNERDLNVVIA